MFVITYFNILFVALFFVNVTSTANVKNERKITGKVVVVTGGTKGVGYAIADNFLKNGAKAGILLGTNVTEGERAERKLNSKYGKNKAEYIECDITTDLDTVSKRILKKYRYVDILVNSETIADEYNPRSIILINTVGTIEWSTRFFKSMRKDKGQGRGGAIINVASVAAHNIDPTYVTYRASKFAVLAFSQSLGHLYNYNITGVRVITLCPGPTDTPLVYKVYSLYDLDLVKKIIKYYNFAKIQSPDNVGRGAVEVFRNAESGTSWDIADEKPPVESANTINIVPFEEIDDDENTHAQKENKADNSNDDCPLISTEVAL